MSVFILFTRFHVNSFTNIVDMTVLKKSNVSVVKHYVTVLFFSTLNTNSCRKPEIHNEVTKIKSICY